MPVSSEYMAFVRLHTVGRKTALVSVRSKSSGATLGLIKWYGPWRQFCFFPTAGTIFNNGCMTDIQSAIAELMEERKRERARERQL